MFVGELCLKSCFLDIGKQEMEHVNKGVCKASIHVKLWVKDAFDEWRSFHGFDKKNIHNKCLQKWIHCKRSCGDVVLGCIHINMNHMTNNRCLVFHVFWSNFILMLQVFDLFTCQCSFYILLTHLIWFGMNSMKIK